MLSLGLTRFDSVQAGPDGLGGKRYQGAAGVHPHVKNARGFNVLRHAVVRRLSTRPGRIIKHSNLRGNVDV